MDLNRIHHIKIYYKIIIVYTIRVEEKGRSR